MTKEAVPTAMKLVKLSHDPNVEACVELEEGEGGVDCQVGAAWSS